MQFLEEKWPELLIAVGIAVQLFAIVAPWL
jgi:hypothetical protein